jgi:tetratricopeptide (TPR) repeat protein
MMLTIWAYLLYVKKGKIKRYLLVLLFFALGLMSKPMLVSLPFILLMLDFWPLGRLRLIHDTRNVVTGQQTNDRLDIFRLLWEKVPFFVLAVVSSAVTFIVQERAMEPLKDYSLQTRIINAFVVYIEYIVNMIWPVKLTVLYPHPGNSLPHWQGVAAGLTLVSITALVVYKARKVPYITVGWLWYIVTLIPVIGIVQVGFQAKADRYTYTTLIGLFVIIAWGANDLLSKLPHRKMWLGTLAAILFPVLIVLTWKQVQYWENSITLYQHTLKHTSNNRVIHYNIGVAFDDQDRTGEAMEHYLQALRIYPDYDAAHNNLGTSLNKQGRTEEAVKHFQQALQISPDFVEVHYNLANAFSILGRTEEAIQHYLQALRLNPDFESAQYNLGNVFDRLDRTEEAIEHYLQALRINPDSFKAHNNLGTVFYKLNRTEEAIEHYLQTLRINPDYATARNNLGTALISKGQIKEAIEVFREVLRVNPGNVNAKHNLDKVLLMQQQK